MVCKPTPPQGRSFASAQASIDNGHPVQPDTAFNALIVRLSSIRNNLQDINGRQSDMLDRVRGVNQAIEAAQATGAPAPSGLLFEVDHLLTDIERRINTAWVHLSDLEKLG